MKKVKLITVIILIAALLISCGSDEEKEKVEEQLQDEPISFEVSKITDSHIGKVKRYMYHVTVNEEADVEDLKGVAEEVVEIAKSETPFNALTIGLYDYPGYANIQIGFTLGSVDYVPYGDWGKAMEINTGNYKEMEYVYNLSEKNWDLRPTNDEAEIITYWWNGIYSLDPYAENDNSEEMMTKETADKFGITPEEYEELQSKFSIWYMNDESRD